MKKVFLKISQNFQENSCARVFLLGKFTRLRRATLLKKKDPGTVVFPVNFEKLLRTPFL